MKRRKLSTFEDYQRALKNKYGLGHGKDYKPWLRTVDVKSKGIRSVIYGRKTQRDHHMMSSIESEYFYLAEFSNSVVDIREQFPIFPLTYTQKVAKVLGIEHPKHPETKLPIVITTDQLLTLETPQGTKYQAVCVKPESETNSLRVLEKIEIERVCWELLGVKFSFFTGNELTRIQSDNISWATSPFRENPRVIEFSQIEAAISMISNGQYFIEDLCDQLISQNIASHTNALTILRHLIAERYIDVDLSLNIRESGVLSVKNINHQSLGAMYGAN